eukprot:1068054-Prorocentrum_minimum.AAC.1
MVATWAAVAGGASGTANESAELNCGRGAVSCLRSASSPSRPRVSPLATRSSLVTHRPPAPHSSSVLFTSDFKRETPPPPPPPQPPPPQGV